MKHLPAFAWMVVFGASLGTSPLAWAAEAVQTSPEPLPAAAYSRAEAVLPQHVDELVFGISVRPQWIGETERFWFERRTPAGREYLRVDPAGRTMEPLFDHAALIAALADATRATVTRKAFRLTDLKADPETGLLRFGFAGKKWRYDPVSRALTPEATPGEKGVESPDGKWRAVVRAGNLVVVSIRDGSEKVLTADGTVDAPYATPVVNVKTMIAEGTALPAVEPDLVWSPDSARIATYRLDLRGARRLAHVQSTPPDDAPPKVFDYVYTLTGDTSPPRGQGIIFDVAAGTRVDIQLPAEPILYYGGPGFEWSADSKAVFESIAERGYKALRLFRIEAATGAARVLTEDRSDTYVDYYGHFWSYDGKSDTHYWTADPTGFAHVYAIDGRSGTRKQLTAGAWRARAVAGIDRADGRVLITGSGRETGRDPYYRHLYAVPAKGGAARLLTPEPLDHDVSVSPGGSYFVDNMSRIDQPTHSVLRSSRDGHIVMELGRADVSAYLAAGYRLPEPFETVAADGKTPIYGAIFKPADFDASKQYPVIEDIYTGPHYVMTPKSFEAAMTGRNDNAMAQLGVIAVTIDGRGTWGRSRAFQQPSYRNLHAVGLDDHIAGIRAIAARNPWMDANRVGVYGFSAGGYDVMRAMTERPEFYKVGVSASGNHDNRLDKASWNEQWMGGDLGPHYDANSNMSWASKLTGKLFLAHGELDENVPPAATLRLADALIKANKDFDFLIVPNADHFLDTVPYFQRRRWDFFVRELIGKAPPQGYAMRPFD